MTGYVTPLGSALLTLIDPDRGAEAEFNRWYERDHFYGGALLGPGVFAGARFLARVGEKELRVTEPGGDPDRMTMFNVYWLADEGADYWRWCTDNVKVLAAAGRMTAPGKVRRVLWLPAPWSESPDADGPPPALALDRRFPAVVLAVVEGAAEEYRARCVRPLCAEDLGVRLVVGDTPMAVDFQAGPVAAEGPAQVATLWFLEDLSTAATFVAAHEKAVGALGGTRTTWLSPFVGTVPGTATHLDQLWLKP